ncbi:MAG: Gfo/Idh/MocA family oxidoreductase [Pedobacter sp.]|nr:Gfo/Idh/MocA family oxidoreductase [Pedobacter sp.]
MKTNKLRWGIIGAGGIANSFVQDFRWMENATLIAIAARDISRAQAFASQYQIPQALSYEELYLSAEIDAVYIATLHHLHYEQALRCIEQGKAVLCEKPITINLAQINDLVIAAKKARVFLMEAMWTYFLPAIHQAKKWLDEGKIGKLKVIQSDFAYPMDKVAQAKMFNPNLAGGSLFELGIYPIAIADYFTNQAPVSISASGKISASGVDESLAITLQYSEVIATLFSSIITRMSNAARFFGENGYIEIPDFWQAKSCKLYNTDYQLVESFEDNRQSHGFIFEMQHANDLILAGKHESDIMPHSRSEAIQETMDEARRQIKLKYPFED